MESLDSWVQALKFQHLGLCPEMDHEPGKPEQQDNQDSLNNHITVHGSSIPLKEQSNFLY